ncbi:MAG: TIGR04282 family arsenosugar biosynthesis glycosyltransferase [Pseudomonadota bacterium]
MSQRVCVFARAPELGRVKTRLAASLGAARALVAHGYLVERQLTCIAQCPNIALELWWTSSQSPAAVVPQAVRQWADASGASCEHQPEGDLGERMRAALEPRQAGQQTLVVGSDVIGLSPALIAAAFAALSDEHTDWVFAPAEDGGFGLVGARSTRDHPFGRVRWGRPAVLRECLTRCVAQGSRWKLTTPVWDVDDAADWERLVRLEPAAALAIR